MKAPEQIAPMSFLRRLDWLDGRPLLEIIEPYRQRILTDALYSLDADGWPRFNFVLSGRAKKNWKTADLILAAMYKFLAWNSPQGNDCLLVANDEAQAGDDLAILVKVVRANQLVLDEVDIRQKEIVRKDGRGTLRILPKNDVIGAHGKTYLFVGFDEIHGYKDHAIFEALALDPTRRDALMWITSYASLFNSRGRPLFDFCERGRAGTDSRMYFSWYSATYGTDPAFNGLPTGEERANPSMQSWGNDGYLAQQRERLPANRYRRLHLNLPLTLDGQYLSADKLEAATASGRTVLPPVADMGGAPPHYRAFVDMSGGSQDDAVLGIAHRDPRDHRIRLDVLTAQSGGKPFNPRHAIAKFAAILKTYKCGSVVGDRYAGNTFVADFGEHGIAYVPSQFSRSDIYEMVEPLINTGIVELLDIDVMREQFLGLVQRGEKIDHVPGEHDDYANAAAGALVHADRHGGAANTTRAFYSDQARRIASELGPIRSLFPPRY